MMAEFGVRDKGISDATAGKQRGKQRGQENKGVRLGFPKES
jgi:hypothetical protein